MRENLDHKWQELVEKAMDGPVSKEDFRRYLNEQKILKACRSHKEKDSSGRKDHLVLVPRD
ncbi:anti-repressor SinI family protein [Halobacillus litoralis]|uniref:anti-repressor SinI family protein n=1 Tax=Halobacillus litoralis TaxID=45668 RepID=UPI001CD1ECB0|nr:anti-repressor SinI family protein [Halobacillus litoralis]MCA1020985.1 anti-repressor SinI family protein [Halobacillus litoralis]